MTCLTSSFSLYEDNDEDNNAIVVGFLDYFDGDYKTLMTMKMVMIKSNKWKSLIIKSLPVGIIFLCWEPASSTYLQNKKKTFIQECADYKMLN